MKRILIVSNDVVVTCSLRGIFEQHADWTVCGSVLYRDAVNTAKQERPDLVVLNISVPVMSGLSATKKVRKGTPSVPLVVFCAITSSRLEEAAVEVGVKSVSSESDLVQSIQKLFSFAA
ncbi:MAG: hypothetical protein QOD84_1578 [Acidobacteriaceae bacterium]|jgi:DNA-binding NarL/FixJ family response regulator